VQKEGDGEEKTGKRAGVRIEMRKRKEITGGIRGHERARR
jgi:hypothetical protein